MKSQICFATPRWHIAGANVPHLLQLRLHLATVAAAVGMAPSHHCAIAADGLMATEWGLMAMARDLVKTWGGSAAVVVI